MANEASRLPREEVEAKLDHLVEVMMSCIDRGMATDGIFRVGWMCAGVRPRCIVNFGRPQDQTAERSMPSWTGSACTP